MSILTITLPNKAQAHLSVAEDTLIFDGQTMHEPSDAKQVALYRVPTNAVGLPFKGSIANLIIENKVLASVVSYNPTVEPITDPDVVAADDPSNGECIVGLTCRGLLLAYVRVTNVEE